MNARIAAPKEYREGPDAAERFKNLMGRVLKVSKEELQRREAEYQESRKREPKPHRKKR